MYKVKLNNEYGIIAILFFGFLLLGFLTIMSIQSEELKYFPKLSIFLIIANIIGIIYEINLIKKYKWLSKNGLLIKNVSFTSYVDYMHINGRPKYDTTIFVEYKLESGETVTLSRNWRGKLDLKKCKTVDILIDKNNPKKRHYIDFNIQKI